MLGKKYGSVEARVVTEENLEVEFENNKFEDANTGTSVSLGIRITNGLKQGYAQTSDITKWKHCLINAVKLMKASNPLIVKPDLSRCKNLLTDRVNNDLLKLEVNDLVGLSEQVVNACNEIKGVKVPNCKVDRNIIKVEFANSEGVNAKYNSGLIELELECNKGSAKGYDTRASTRLDINFSEVGRKAADMCIKSINPVRLNTSKRTVVLDYLAANEFISILAYNLMADNVIENRSFFKGKENQQVVSDGLTIIDDGKLKNGIGSRPFDNEGVRTKCTTLITNGILRGFLNDLYTSKRMNVESTGNCDSLIKRPGIGLNNLTIKEGNISNENIIEDSLFITYILGAHTINCVSGDFSVSPNNAFLIKKGVWKPLKNIMISGNIFQLFNSVEAISKTQRQDTLIRTPLLRFKDVQVIG